MKSAVALVVVLMCTCVETIHATPCSKFQCHFRCRIYGRRYGVCHGTVGSAAECKCFLKKAGEENAGPTERGCPDSSLYCTSWCRSHSGQDMFYGKCHEDICVCVPRGAPNRNEMVET